MFKRNNLLLFVLLLIIFSINLFFTTLPLLNTLHYEVSFFNAILLSLLSGLFTLSFLKKDKSGNEIFTNKSYIYSILLFLFIPFIISFISTIFCQQCPISDGIYFYLIITVPSVLIGSTIVIFGNFISQKYKYLAFISIWIVLSFAFLTELYFNPQIYFFNSIFAYFPGVMYDVHIEITKELLLYRFFNILFSIAVISLITKFNSEGRRSKLIVIAIVIILCLMFNLLKVTLGFATNIERIKSELTNTIETEHFEIILPSNISERELRLVSINHEFYYNELKQLLQVEPKHKITSVLFKTGAQKKILFGSKNANVAKLWSEHIYLNYGNYEKSLLHEMAHVFSAEFANGLFKMPAKYNPGLLEGYAMAIENNYDDFDIDYLALLAQRSGYKISLNSLFSTFSFFTNTSSISYIYAGSFIKYIANNYGWETVNKLYTNLEFEIELNKNLTELETEYYEYLDSLKVKGNKYVADLYFGRVPLVKQYCARATAKELENSWELVGKKKYFIALEQFDKIYKYSHSYNALRGIITCNNFAKAYNKNIDLISNEMNSYKGSAYYFNLELLLADAYILKNANKSANTYLDSLMIQKPRVDYYNAAILRAILLEKNDSSAINYVIHKKSRNNIVTSLLNENPSNEILQIYLEECEIGECDYSNVSNRINELCTKHKYSSETYFQLSKFAFNNLDFKNAKKYAELASKNTDFKRKAIIIEYIKKIKWAKENNKLHNG